MPQQFTQKAVNTFVGGLITEAGELTFPPNASIDELNCDLNRDGSRRRRLGIEFEDSYSLLPTSFTDGLTTSINYWENVSGEAGLHYVVLQRGSTLYFYIDGVEPLSGNGVTISDVSSTIYTVDLTTFQKTGGSASTEVVECASYNGDLIVASPEINTFYIVRDPDDGTFTETQISFRVRDFSWQGEKTEYFDGDATPSEGRKYDTENCGWTDTKGDAALSAYQSANSSEWPPLNLPWYAGKDSNGAFSASEWAETEGGTSLIVNGHFILDLYAKDRATPTGYTLTTETETARFSTVATYAGRVFYSGMQSKKNGSRIYFTQVVDDISEVGDCFQINDPTNEYFSDLLDTDGGFVNIPAAHNIQKLHVFGTKLYVFAENGVWAIAGVDEVFTPAAYAVNKISESGILSKTSFVSAYGRPYWWSAFGIHTIGMDQTGQVQEDNLSLPTIQTFFDNIGTAERAEVKAAYDGTNNRIYWIYPDANDTIDPRYTNILIFDEALRAFFPWSVPTSTSYIVNILDLENTGFADITFNVVDSSNNQVIDSSTNMVVQDSEARAFNSNTKMRFLVKDGVSGQLTFAQFKSITFLDWTTDNYSSYAEAAHDFFGDLTLKKNAPYVTVYFKRTETAFEEDVSGYKYDRPSSCTMKAYWDFKVSPSSSQEVYREKTPAIVNENDLTDIDQEETVLATRVKVRGRGRSMRLKFESTEGKDFHLLGWEVVGARNPRM